jgi:hypothetical protein
VITLIKISVSAFRAPAVSAASQAIGLVQLVLILARAGTNNATDAYFYLFNLGLVPINCIVVGLMYPSLLNEFRLSRAGLRTIRWVTPLCGALFVCGGAAWLAWRDRLTEGLLALVILTGANAVVQAGVWFRAVAAEAGGNALWIAGIALPPNLLAVAALAYPWTEPATAMTTMMAGLLGGNLALAVFMHRRAVGDDIVASADEHGAGSGSLWFLALSSSSYVGQTVLQSLAVLLPASGITLLNVAYKLVGSVSATFVNATMPSLVHRDTESRSAARRFLRLVAATVTAGGLGLVGAVRVLRPELVLPALVVATWLLCSTASAVAARMSFRFLRPGASGRTIAVVVAVVALTALTSYGPGFSLTVLLCAYAALDGGSAMLLLWPLRDRLMSVALGAAMVAVLGVALGVVVLGAA